MRERVGESLRRRHREAGGFVEFGRGVVDARRGIPEHAHELHALGVVPDVGGHRAAVRDADGFAERVNVIRHEVEHEAGHHDVGRIGRQRELLRARVVERHAVAEAFPRGAEETLGGFDPRRRWET